MIKNLVSFFNRGLAPAPRLNKQILMQLVSVRNLYISANTHSLEYSLVLIRQKVPNDVTCLHFIGSSY